MYLTCELSTLDEISNFHKYSEFLTVIYFAKLCNLKVYINENLIIKNIFNEEKIQNLNKKYDIFTLELNDVNTKYTINGNFKWEGLNITEIDNIINLINNEKNKNTNLIIFKNVIRINPQIMYKYNNLIFKNFIEDFSYDIFNFEKNISKNEILIHIRSGDLLERFAKQFGLTLDYYIKIIEYYKNNYSLPINILTESLNDNRIYKKINTKTKYNNLFMTNLKEYCLKNSINLIFGDPKNDFLRDFKELTNYKYLFLSPSGFSHQSIPLNINKNIIVEKKIINSRPNLLNDIEFLPNVTLLDIENI